MVFATDSWLVLFQDCYTQLTYRIRRRLLDDHFLVWLTSGHRWWQCEQAADPISSRRVNISWLSGSRLEDNQTCLIFYRTASRWVHKVTSWTVFLANQSVPFRKSGNIKQEACARMRIVVAQIPYGHTSNIWPIRQCERAPDYRLSGICQRSRGI